jgi:hypothetical protein
MSSSPFGVTSRISAKPEQHRTAIATSIERAKSTYAEGEMRADANSLTLFDDDLDGVARLRQAAWDHASRIAFIGRKGVQRAAIEGLSNALLRMCIPRDLNGEHWSPERQMHWLEQEAYRRCREAPTAVEMEAWLLERFDPPPPSSNSFAAWDRARETWRNEATCKLCFDSGKLLADENGQRDFCACAAGEEAEREEAQTLARDPATLGTRRPEVRPPSFEFDEYGGVHPPRQRKRQGKPTGKGWGNLTPTLERFQGLLAKDPNE